MSNLELGEIPVERLTGDERFAMPQSCRTVHVRDFWAWSGSNLLDNTARGILAEFLVASAIGCAEGTRAEWESFDISVPEGPRIEVKSASYIQRWRQTELSKISFDIAPKEGWDPHEGWIGKGRHSDVYVFCLLATKDQSKIDPLDLRQWEFLVLATRTLDARLPNQKNISLRPLKALDPRHVSFDRLRQAVLAEANVM